VLILVILYSAARKYWKLADFGSASVGTSKQLNTTKQARGTEGYRAPEILTPKGKCNNKADLFALDCVIYEIVTADKLFEMIGPSSSMLKARTTHSVLIDGANPRRTHN